MTIHANSDIGHNHKTHNWEFADAAARTAHTYATGDVGKEALQLDDSTFWKIIAVASGVATFREVAPTATVQHFRGKYTSSGALITAHPTALDGDYAIVDSGAGTNADEYIWDANEGWIKSTAAGAGSTDTLTEGSTNLYFTGARAIASVLTGFTAGAGTVSATDSILQAIQKVVGNVSGLSLFKTISVAGQSDVVADSQTDTLTLAAGSNITITTDASTDTVTIAAAGGGGDTTASEGALIDSATAKTTPVDADMFGLMDSAASNMLKKLSWSNTKATLKIYFDTLYMSSVIVATKGYAMGGYATTYSSEIDGIIFATEAAINPAAVLSVARVQLAGTSSSTTGYAMGGAIGSDLSEIDGITFVTEAATNPAAVLSIARGQLVGTSSSTTGYAMGGTTGSYSSEIDGITFATEAVINPAAALSVARSRIASTSSSTTGYLMGGFTGSYLSEIDGITFATEAAINPAAALSVARAGMAGTSSSTTGYAMGGTTGSYSSEIDGITFATEAVINPAAALSVARYLMANTSSSTTGYAMGGNTGSSLSEIDGITFATEAAINPAAALSVARYGAAGVQY